MTDFMNYNFNISKIILACYVSRTAGERFHKNRQSHGLAFHISGEKTYIFDNGKSFERRYGGKKQRTPFDEGTAYQRRDGSIHLLARTKLGYIARSVSADDGESWTDGELTDIESPNTRLFISRTPSGRVLLVNNDDREVRQRMTVYLSEDDGVTFKYKKCIDPRRGLSYPDVDFCDGKIYLTYDRERTGAKEILLAVFTEDDIIDKNSEIEINIVSKP